MAPFLTRKRLAATGVVVLVLGGAVAAASARTESSPSYRTAEASREEVDQELHTVGSVEPVSQASVSFPVAGTVEGVDVSVGQAVTVGSRLATLDVAGLEVALHEKQAALDQANLVLQLALDGEDVSSLSAGGAPAGGGFGRAAVNDADAELKAAQQAVLDAQKAVDEATAAADLAYDNAVSVCSEAAVQATVEESTTTTSAGSSSDACLSALQAVLDAQAQVTAAQAQLTDAVDALNALLDERADTPSTPTTTAPSSPSVPGTGNQTPNTEGGSVPSGSSGSPSTGTGSAGSSSPSAEDLVSYQKAVDAAEDEVAVAQQAIDQATIVSPIDGRIASVNLAVGDEVEAASSTANIVVVGEGGFEVTTSVSIKDLPNVEVGQTAMVEPDGDDEAVEGEVVRIGVSADSTGSSYPVTIGLTGDTSAMGNGSTASVVIVTSAARQALAVPTSAVTVDGDTSTVQVVVDGKAKETKVETGAVSSTWTEITDGLEEGDVVVLADLDEPLPGSATDTSSSSSQGQGPGGGTFTFPGGGALPGGGSFRPPGN